MATSVSVSATNNAEIDGLLSGYKWTGTISYSFPDSPSDYANPYTGGSSEPTKSGFASAPTQMQAAITYAIGLILGYTNATIQYNGTGSGDIMIAQSPSANPTSYAYYPGNYASGGDIWFGTQYDYSQAKLGNYYFATALHELGHALGLKHSQEAGGPANVAVPSAHDDSEYTVMSYRSYVGASTTSGYTNEAFGFSQTYMANDILALQTMYGADYTTQSSNTVYTWNPSTGQEFINGVGQLAPGGGVGGSANRIYETVWDGGGVDTYDLSNYTTNLTVNLNPGAASVFSSAQLANLGNGHYASGNVYNACLYNNDARSYIDNAIGGSGNDTIIGNAIANVLNGGGGNDTIIGGGGNDTIVGGAGADTAVYSGSEGGYAITYDSTSQTFTIVDQRTGSPDGTDTVTGVENFQFNDGTMSSSTLISLLTPLVIDAVGATSLVQAGNGYFLSSTANGGSNLQLKYGGSGVVAGQFGGWTPIGAEATGSGFEVAWKVAGADQYTVWNTDSSGNYTSNAIGAVSGKSYELESLETSFHQDLNGDGVVGIVASTIESFGLTALVQQASRYFLSPVGGGSNVQLKYGGSGVVTGEFGDWTPIGAEATGSGFEVAWKVAGVDQYTVWNTDSSGNYVSNAIGALSGRSYQFESLETSFHQDLNGDGLVGVATSTIESFGSTALVQQASTYFLSPSGGGSGTELKFGGFSVVAGQFGSWTPIGAESTGSGYELAWKVVGSDLYTVWNTDSSGNYTSNAIGAVSGKSYELESLEPSFHQDLNGDGVVGIVASTIESFGLTALVQQEHNYFLSPAGNGSNVQLKYGGSSVVTGEFGDWTPIGAEVTGGGFEVAWKVAGADQYTVWNTDSSGNYTSNAVGVLSGGSYQLEALETSFHQDLNGDGVVGIATSAVETLGSHSSLGAPTPDHFVILL
ncbi:M10 family metallopeptidase C-terminal domain-containing protein [Bradyrhizobium sacchari]|uniref:Serralysin n=1 Tax=Bradyrhizobium sacchari TaxID=1399419 RepID=A0A560JNB1_9BRAD|nr:M10 family metallopeptidase C-terminal domain-containing protein [Bradyrhizobium sacchari]TWB59174.1 serralysin [Bradyrhizobium sacchari]TWB72466.1 serralysin [Bradyrhizobium sacchari]